MSDNLLLTVWTSFPEGGAKLAMMLAVAEASNEQGNCYLTVEQLGALARVSRRSAQRAVNQLRSSTWLLTSRIHGQGGRLVYQLHTTKLARSSRSGCDDVLLESQRARSLGDTEAGLAERIRPRGLPVAAVEAVGRETAVSQLKHMVWAGDMVADYVLGQSGTATSGAQDRMQDTESQADTAPNGHTTDFEAPQNELEETLLSRHVDERSPAEFAAAVESGKARYQAYIDGSDSQGEIPGAGVPEESPRRVVEPPTATFDPEFAMFDDSDEDEQEIAALRVQAERSSQRALFVPKGGVAR